VRSIVGIPTVPDDKGQSAFIGRTARRYFASLLVFAAMDMPHLLNLTELYDFVEKPIKLQFDTILEFATIDSVRKTVRSLKEELDSGSDRQVVWYAGRVRDSLVMYRKGSARGDALNGNSFDISELRRKPSTLFIEMSEDSLDRDAAHISRLMTCLSTQLANSPGNRPIIFIIDECSQLPKWPLGKFIRVYRKHGFRYVSFWQSHKSGEDAHGRDAFTDILDSSGSILHMSVSSESIARSISQRAGDKTTFSRSANVSRGGYGASENMGERGLSRLPVANILNMPRHGLLIEKVGMPLIKASRRPWWELNPYSSRLKHFSEMVH